MQPFCFFVARRKGTSFGRPEGLPSVAKEVGVLPYGYASQGGLVPEKSKNIKK